MKIKKLNILISFILIILLSLIVYLTIDSQFRRTIYSKTIGGYKLINYHIVGGYAHGRDFKKGSDRIIKYIKFSQKFSFGKNVMLPGIIDTTALLTSKAYTQEEFNQIQNVYIEINNITDDIYKNHVWLARAYMDDDIEKSKEHLIKALKLSKSSEEAYREIIQIFSNRHVIPDLVKSYCKDYFQELAGTVVGRIATAQDDNNFFQGNNSNFAISKNGNFKDLNIKFIGTLNNYEKYEFIFEKEENLLQFEILKHFFSGSKISIKNVKIFNDKVHKLNFNNTVIHSLGSYIINQTSNEIVFLSGNLKDDIFKFNFKEEYRDVKKIVLELKFEKLALSNKSICINFNEN
tara:strand:- start:55 stop:1098 length:1044 start_codon:yes stop_codon:yes gene_type:complete